MPLAYGLYIGDASRTYAHGIDVVTGGGRAYVADVNADGKDDLLVFTPIWASDGITDLASEVTVLLSRGDGTFDKLPAAVIPLGSAPDLARCCSDGASPTASVAP